MMKDISRSQMTAIKKLVEAETTKQLRKHVRKATNDLFTITALVLKDEEGWNRDQLHYFFERVQKLDSGMTSGHLTMEDIKAALKEEMDIEFI